MIFENLETQLLLHRIVVQVSGDPAWHDDLMQEALIHLWRREEERPNQSLSWYLQSCQFHLRHHLALGRSIDSWKRRDQAIAFSPQHDDDLNVPLHDHSNSTPISEISAKEMLDLLRERLTTLQQTILSYLNDGLSSREIGMKVRVSHKTVLKHRSRIANVALGLGITTRQSK